ncbi:hypothetical protein SD71_04900 [Cohnella kolymensis]|uniref:Uncharacterized protein n=1 Tax=Cohnella kolymensis TaxID=1590652 RepID=A0ABR5A9C8_9BACL|nr:hypothetical protein [Cohnella kolymensis]KIL37017.1 hypothetical protein SD71_04900 [Cohnella kolymensis]
MGMLLQKELYDDQGAVVESLRVTKLQTQTVGPIESEKVLKGESIESTLVTMEEPPGSAPLKGVAYHVLLFSDTQIMPEELSSYKVEVLPASDIAIGGVQPIMFSKATDGGFLYSLRFETRYGDYTQAELDKLMSARDFIIFITHDRRALPVKLQLIPEAINKNNPHWKT